MSPAPNGKSVRDGHRQALTLHFVAMVSVLATLAILNRLLSPERLWVGWVALAWGVAFLFHLARFERGTMATMGKKRGPASSGATKP